MDVVGLALVDVSVSRDLFLAFFFIDRSVLFPPIYLFLPCGVRIDSPCLSLRHRA